MALHKNDFVEIEFVGKIKDGEIFDTNIRFEAEKMGLKLQSDKPFILSIGRGMILEGFDKELEGKELNKEYSVELSPEQSFGKRDEGLVKIIPLNLFLEQDFHPEAGMQLSLDGNIVKIISISSEGVLVDFNNLLAGKTVVYTYKMKRKVEDLNEKINALQDFFMGRRFEYGLSDNNELTFKIPQTVEKFVQFFAKPFNEILGLKVNSEIVGDASKTDAEKK